VNWMPLLGDLGLGEGEMRNSWGWLEEEDDRWVGRLGSTEPYRQCAREIGETWSIRHMFSLPNHRKD
jgi:hypothetical protein